MKGYRIVLLALGLLLLFGVSAAPALACDDGCCCCDPKTPGFWKNHPCEWPAMELEIGGVLYTQAEMLPMLKQVSGDKWYTLFRALVAAELNDLECDIPDWVDEAMDGAQAWFCANPAGTVVPASSCAWGEGECLYLQLDCWNNM